MKIVKILCVWALLCPLVCFAQKKDYLYYVREHYDHLIGHGKDTYGARSTRMLASVIDTRDMSVPKGNVPPTEGIRGSDRAVGGSNFYHDAEMIRIAKELTRLTGDKKYSESISQYAADFLKYAQNPTTGLLGWGEHIYYNFYGDTVMEEELAKNSPYKAHEFIETIPVWSFLWEIDSAATHRAIAGVRYHFRSGVTQSFLYNRHARWHKADKPEYRGLEQYQDGGQAWIKHSGLQCYSFSFLYSQTGDKQWKRWAEGAGNLFWNYRNPETDLTISCIDDPRPSGVNSSLPGSSLLAYYLLKSSALHPEFAHLKDRAERILQSVEKYSWDEKRKGYYSEIDLNGKPTDANLIKVINTGYGAADILLFGRIAAYFYKTTGNPVYRNMVKKAADLVRVQTWPDRFVMNSLAGSIHFLLDAAEVLDDRQLVTNARTLADTGVKKLWSGKLFVRQPNDPYYESKLGINDFASGLLRLHFLEMNDAARAGLVIWSF